MTVPVRLWVWVGFALLLSGCASEGGEDGPLTVRMQEAKFVPATLTVPVGTTVTWVNDDPFQHTVTPLDAALWGSEGSGSAEADFLDEGETWSFTFAAPGTYRYRCIPHSFQENGEWRGQLGTIVVP